MAMPWQLAQAKRPKRSEPRPIVEQLPRLDIGDLVRLKVFPKAWHTRHTYEVGFRYPFLKSIVVTLAFIEANHHSGYTQRIKLKWIRTGFGGNWKPRPCFICPRCTRPVTKVYLQHGSLGCRRCSNALYASQICSGRQMRAKLQAKRLTTFLSILAPQTKQTTKQRLLARHRALRAKAGQAPLESSRFDHRALAMQSNYNTQGPAYWR
jgi:hypothetical protein